IKSPPSVPSFFQRPWCGGCRRLSFALFPCLALMYSSRGQLPRLLGEKYGRFGNTFGGFEYHFAICASSSLSQTSLRLNQSSSNAIKSPSTCDDKFTLLFVKLSSPF